MSSEIKTYSTHFCGCGGACHGIEQAGLECVKAIDYLDYAVEYRLKNLGHQATLMDISEYEPAPEDAADLLWTSPPCFVAGTMILCLDGFKPIETVSVGDCVLTHKGNWRKVTSTMVRNGAEVIKIEAHGVPSIICTNEHPFYIRKMHRKNIRRNSSKRIFQDAEFIEAQKLKNESTKEGMYLGQVLPPESSEDDHSTYFWYLIGRYLADGWSYERDRSFIICGNLNEEAELRKIFEDAGYSAHTSIERTSIRFSIYGTDLYEFVQQFGKYAHGKKIPGWVFSLNKEKACSLLDGYFSGDGNRNNNNNCWTANSVSKALALSIALLCQNGYGKIAGCRFCQKSASCVIEGRTVNQRSYWTTSVFDKNTSGMIDGNYGWKRFRKSKSNGGATVYNISVEEDESYVADGAIVHNCQTFSSAAREKSIQTANKDDVRNNLFLASIKYVDKIRPRFVVLENVMGLLTHNADEDGNGSFADMKKAFLKLGYTVEWNVLNSSHFGLPQDRERVFIICSRDGEKGLVPAEPVLDKKPKFADIMEHGAISCAWGAETYITAYKKGQRLALKNSEVGIEILRGHEATCLEIMPTMTCGWGGGATRKKVAVLDKTTEGVSFLRHPTVLEGARAQGFPDTWVWPKASDKAWTLIGNAVSSPVSKAIIEHLKKVSRGEKPSAKSEISAKRMPKYVRASAPGSLADCLNDVC